MTEPKQSRFNDFVILQAQNAGLFLGQLPHPTTGKTSVNITAADSVIQSLEMLKEKTEGNLSDPETALLDAAISNLDKLYEEVTSTLEDS